MNPNEALNLLDQAVAQLQLPRDGHVKLQEAVSIVKEAIKPQDTPNAIIKGE